MARQRDTSAPQRVVAFDRTGDRDVAVLVERSGDSYRMTQGEDPGVATRVGVAPWERSLVRCRGVDDLPADELLRVLGILGDGELPERVPAWRRGCGALPARGESRTALLTAWMPGESDAGEDGATYTTAPAALALAVWLEKGCAYLSDTEQGVLIVAVHGPEGVLVRSLRETPDLVGSDEHTERRLREAAAAVGLHDSEVRSALDASVEPWEGRRIGWSVGVGEALARRVRGWPTSENEAATVLLAVCAGMLAASDDPAVRALAGIRAHEPPSRAKAGQRVDAWLSSWRHVALACVVCLLVLLFAPLLSAKVREAMLSSKTARAEALREQYQADARLAAIYSQLNDRVWPMTKMLAEVTSAAPVHVVVESIRLDSGAQIDIEGFVQVAPRGPTLEGPPETLLTRYETTLNELGTLGSVTVVRREVVDDSVEFQLSARVQNPTARGNVPMDYAEMPLAELLYGKGASNTASPLVASASTATARSRPSTSTRTRDDSERASRDSAIESGRESSGDRRPSGESGPASVDGVPTPISDEEIAKLDRRELLNQWRIRRGASREASTDQETRARLAEEAEKLMARYQATGSDG